MSVDNYLLKVGTNQCLRSDLTLQPFPTAFKPYTEGSDNRLIWMYNTKDKTLQSWKEPKWVPQKVQLWDNLGTLSTFDVPDVKPANEIQFTFANSTLIVNNECADVPTLTIGTCTRTRKGHTIAECNQQCANSYPFNPKGKAACDALCTDTTYYGTLFRNSCEIVG